MPSVDPLLGRVRRPNYDCLDFLSEAWEMETGESLTGRLGRLFDKERLIVRITRNFKRLERPESPCVVIMSGGQPEVHVGLYVRGRVLHLRQRAEFMPIDVAARGFTRLRFYK